MCVPTNALGLHDGPETREDASREGRLTHLLDAQRLERAKQDRGEGLCRCRRGEIDGHGVLSSALGTDDLRGLRLEELKETKLGCSLQHVAGHGGPEAKQKRADAFLTEHCAEAIEESSVATLLKLC